MTAYIRKYNLSLEWILEIDTLPEAYLFQWGQRGTVRSVVLVSVHVEYFHPRHGEKATENALLGYVESRSSRVVI